MSPFSYKGFEQQHTTATVDSHFPRQVPFCLFCSSLLLFSKSWRRLSSSMRSCCSSKSNCSKTNRSLFAGRVHLGIRLGRYGASGTLLFLVVVGTHYFRVHYHYHYHFQLVAGNATLDPALPLPHQVKWGLAPALPLPQQVKRG